jgi:hypothetical protein
VKEQKGGKRRRKSKRGERGSYCAGEGEKRGKREKE